MKNKLLLSKFLVDNYKHIKVTKVFYVNNYTIPKEKPSCYKDMERMYQCSDNFFNWDAFCKFIAGKLPKLYLSDGYDEFYLYKI